MSRPSINLTPFKKDIVNLYLQGVSMNNIRYKYNCGVTSIKNLLIDNKINLRTRSQTRKWYSINENYFEKIDSHEKAYWLGFIYADGNIYKTKLQIGLAKKDKCILQQFQKHINSGHKLYNDRQCFKLIIPNCKIVKDLIKLGCNYRKSLTLTFPKEKQCPRKFINSFILGYFDGDGCIQFRSPKYIRTHNTKRGKIGSFKTCKTWNFSIISTKEFLICALKYLQPIIQSKITFSQYKRLMKNVWTITVGGGCKTEIGKAKATRLYNYLYSNIDFSLKRKYSIFRRIID
jgi:hypothetical protein